MQEQKILITADQYAAGLNYNIFPDLRLSAIAKQFFGKNTEENKLTLDIVLQMVF